MAVWLPRRKSTYNIDCIHQQNAIKLMSYVSSPQVTNKVAYSKRPRQYQQNLKKRVLFSFPYNQPHTVNSCVADT